jgi:hypothetical protein
LFLSQDGRSTSSHRFFILNKTGFQGTVLALVSRNRGKEEDEHLFLVIAKLPGQASTIRVPISSF